MKWNVRKQKSIRETERELQGEADRKRGEGMLQACMCVCVCARVCVCLRACAPRSVCVRLSCLLSGKRVNQHNPVVWSPQRHNQVGCSIVMIRTCSLLRSWTSGGLSAILYESVLRHASVWQLITWERVFFFSCKWWQWHISQDDWSLWMVSCVTWVAHRYGVVKVKMGPDKMSTANTMCSQHILIMIGQVYYQFQYRGNSRVKSKLLMPYDQCKLQHFDPLRSTPSDIAVLVLFL